MPEDPTETAAADSTAPLSVAMPGDGAAGGGAQAAGSDSLAPSASSALPQPNVSSHFKPVDPPRGAIGASAGSTSAPSSSSRPGSPAKSPTPGSRLADSPANTQRSLPNEYRPVGRTGKLQAAERPLTAMQPPASPTEGKKKGERAKPAFPADGKPQTADDALLSSSASADDALEKLPSDVFAKAQASKAGAAGVEAGATVGEEAGALTPAAEEAGASAVEEAPAAEEPAPGE